MNIRKKIKIYISSKLDLQKVKNCELKREEKKTRLVVELVQYQCE